MRFNAGTIREVDFTELGCGTYCTTNRNYYYYAGWLKEALHSFDLIPLVREFLSNGTYIFRLLSKPGSSWTYYYCLVITRTNDVIKVYCGGMRSTQTTPSTDREIASFQIGSIPSSYNVWFVYLNNTLNSRIFVFYLQQLKRVTFAKEQVENYYRIKGTESSDLYTLGTVESGYSTLNKLTDAPTVNIADYPDTWLNRYAQPGFYLSNEAGSGTGYYNWMSSDGQDMEGLYSSDGEDPGPTPPEPTPPGPSDDPNDEGDPSDEDGGDGDHTPTYDPIPIPPTPTQGAATAGFITLYKLHQAAMSQFASDMFASSLWEAIKQFFGTPMDFLVGVNLLPFEPTAGPSFKPAYGPTAVFGHAYPTVANQYVDVDCGTITLDKYWGSCFDYEPYTKIQIWLPYIGYRDLPVDEVMGKTIGVKYRCDCLTGDCVAFINTGVVGEIGPQIPRVIGQYYGNCAVRIPFGASSYDAAISNSIALMGAAATNGLSAAGGALMETGGAVGGSIAAVEAFGGAIAATPGTANSAMGVVTGTKPNVHKGGAAGAATGYMSIQVPYIIRRIPRQNLPSNYKDLKGYPCNIGGKLDDFTGLAIVDDIQLNDIPALEDERKEIIAWLRGGVLI